MGIETGVELESVRDATRFISAVLRRDVASRAYNALEALAARA
jgi:hypothetical protein